MTTPEREIVYLTCTYSRVRQTTRSAWSGCKPGTGDTFTGSLHVQNRYRPTELNTPSPARKPRTGYTFTGSLHAQTPTAQPNQHTKSGAQTRAGQHHHR